MRYRLRTLLILLTLAPPVLAITWTAIDKYLASKRIGVWEDVGGPGAIDEFGGNFSLYIDDDGNVFCGPTKLADGDCELH
jgi:hypothetical protein